ncbi:hypothetical protein H4Q32_005272 [Labeo rohita]|uniref:Uncharacterized protein n=1 Tax=Labeo rohita TaxID=84645 RepID=A0ABQ8N0P3_LABRO|nr:hypothetical protein H4Q32_005272 [Labeo rohita]
MLNKTLSSSVEDCKGNYLSNSRPRVVCGAYRHNRYSTPDQWESLCKSSIFMLMFLSSLCTLGGLSSLDVIVNSSLLGN